MQKKPRSKRYRFVSGHAIERLRERIITLGTHQHRLDIDLEQWLDAAVENAIRRGDVKTIMDRGHPARVVDITLDLDAPAFALIKTNTHKSAEFAEVVMTVMDGEMVEQLEKGRWRDDKFRPLAEGLAKVTLAPPEPAEPVLHEEFLISYVGSDGLAHELVPRTRLKTMLVELALESGVEEETIRVWREVPSTVKVSVEVEL